MNEYSEISTNNPYIYLKYFFQLLITTILHYRELMCNETEHLPPNVANL